MVFWFLDGQGFHTTLNGYRSPISGLSGKPNHYSVRYRRKKRFKAKACLFLRKNQFEYTFKLISSCLHFAIIVISDIIKQNRDRGITATLEKTSGKPNWAEGR